MAPRKVKVRTVIRRVGNRIEVTGLTGLWTASTPVAAAACKAYRATVVNHPTEGKAELLFPSPRAAQKAFAAALEHDAFGMDGVISDDHVFDAPELRGLAG